MRKSYKKFRPQAPIVTQRVNHQIKATEVRLIDENGEMVGVVSIQEALRRADEAGLDLIEVSPKAEPPVAKILSFSSFKYQKEKELKAMKQKTKAAEMKGVRLSVRIGEHDLEIRNKQVQNFLAEGHKVKIELNLKGRERQHSGQAMEVVRNFVKALSEISRIEQPISQQGGRFTTIIAPKNEEK